VPGTFGQSKKEGSTLHIRRNGGELLCHSQQQQNWSERHAWAVVWLVLQIICLQELEEAALKVMGTQAGIRAQLEEKNAELAVIKEEYETKKKEVSWFWLVSPG